MSNQGQTEMPESSASESEGYPSSCPVCQADLTLDSSVIREYVNKDNNPDNDEEAGEDVMAYGHYENGEFVSDFFKGFGGGNFDLPDDSDLCDSCNANL